MDNNNRQPGLKIVPLGLPKPPSGLVPKYYKSFKAIKCRYPLGTCRWGVLCVYAHGEHELRPAGFGPTPEEAEVARIEIPSNLINWWHDIRIQYASLFEQGTSQPSSRKSQQRSASAPGKAAAAPEASQPAVHDDTPAQEPEPIPESLPQQVDHIVHSLSQLLQACTLATPPAADTGIHLLPVVELSARDARALGAAKQQAQVVNGQVREMADQLVQLGVQQQQQLERCHDGYVDAAQHVAALEAARANLEADFLQLAPHVKQMNSLLKKLSKMEITVRASPAPVPAPAVGPSPAISTSHTSGPTAAAAAAAQQATSHSEGGAGDVAVVVGGKQPTLPFPPLQKSTNSKKAVVSKGDQAASEAQPDTAAAAKRAAAKAAQEKRQAEQAAALAEERQRSEAAAQALAQQQEQQRRAAAARAEEERRAAEAARLAAERERAAEEAKRAAEEARRAEAARVAAAQRAAEQEAARREAMEAAAVRRAGQTWVKEFKIKHTQWLKLYQPLICQPGSDEMFVRCQQYITKNGLQVIKAAIAYLSMRIETPSRKLPPPELRDHLDLAHPYLMEGLAGWEAAPRSMPEYIKTLTWQMATQQQTQPLHNLITYMLEDMTQDTGLPVDWPTHWFHSFNTSGTVGCKLLHELIKANKHKMLDHILDHHPMEFVLHYDLAAMTPVPGSNRRITGVFTWAKGLSASMDVLRVLMRHMVSDGLLTTELVLVVRDIMSQGFPPAFLPELMEEADVTVMSAKSFSWVTEPLVHPWKPSLLPLPPPPIKKGASPVAPNAKHAKTSTISATAKTATAGTKAATATTTASTKAATATTTASTKAATATPTTTTAGTKAATAAPTTTTATTKAAPKASATTPAAANGVKPGSAAGTAGTAAVAAAMTTAREGVDANYLHAVLRLGNPATCLQLVKDALQLCKRETAEVADMSVQMMSGLFFVNQLSCGASPLSHAILRQPTLPQLEDIVQLLVQYGAMRLPPSTPCTVPGCNCAMSHANSFDSPMHVAISEVGAGRLNIKTGTSIVRSLASGCEPDAMDLVQPGDFWGLNVLSLAAVQPTGAQELVCALMCARKGLCYPHQPVRPSWLPYLIGWVTPFSLALTRRADGGADIAKVMLSGWQPTWFLDATHPCLPLEHLDAVMAYLSNDKYAREVVLRPLAKLPTPVRDDLLAAQLKPGRLHLRRILTSEASEFRYDGVCVLDCMSKAPLTVAEVEVMLARGAHVTVVLPDSDDSGTAAADAGVQITGSRPAGVNKGTTAAAAAIATSGGAVVPSKAAGSGGGGAVIPSKTAGSSGGGGGGGGKGGAAAAAAVTRPPLPEPPVLSSTWKASGSRVRFKTLKRGRVGSKASPTPPRSSAVSVDDEGMKVVPSVLSRGYQGPLGALPQVNGTVKLNWKRGWKLAYPGHGWEEEEEEEEEDEDDDEEEEEEEEELPPSKGKAQQSTGKASTAHKSGASKGGGTPSKGAGTPSKAQKDSQVEKTSVANSKSTQAGAGGAAGGASLSQGVLPIGVLLQALLRRCNPDPEVTGEVVLERLFQTLGWQAAAAPAGVQYGHCYWMRRLVKALLQARDQAGQGPISSHVLPKLKLEACHLFGLGVGADQGVADLLRVLLASGAVDPDERDSRRYSMTLLHLAAADHAAEAVAVLLEAGADPTAQILPRHSCVLHPQVYGIHTESTTTTTTRGTTAAATPTGSPAKPSSMGKSKGVATGGGGEQPPVNTRLRQWRMTQLASAVLASDAASTAPHAAVASAAELLMLGQVTRVTRDKRDGARGGDAAAGPGKAAAQRHDRLVGSTALHTAVRAHIQLWEEEQAERQVQVTYKPTLFGECPCCGRRVRIRKAVVEYSQGVQALQAMCDAEQAMEGASKAAVTATLRTLMTACPALVTTKCTPTRGVTSVVPAGLYAATPTMAPLRAAYDKVVAQMQVVASQQQQALSSLGAQA